LVKEGTDATALAINAPSPSWSVFLSLTFRFAYKFALLGLSMLPRAGTVVNISRRLTQIQLACAKAQSFSNLSLFESSGLLLLQCLVPNFD
jgi:hypothetical protein